MEEMHIKNSKKLPKSNNMSSKAPPAQNNLREILDRIGKLSSMQIPGNNISPK